MQATRSLAVSGVFAILLASAPIAFAQAGIPYQKPPASIATLLDAPPSPVSSISPHRDMLAIEQPSSFPTIAEMGQPRLQLAGLRFSPSTNNLSRGTYATALALQKTSPGSRSVSVKGLPPHLKLQHLAWSPDGKHIAFIQIEDSLPRTAGLHLYIVDVATGQARRIETPRLNGVVDSPCSWLADSESLLCSAVPAARGPEPQRNPVPDGPVISENIGKVSPGRTYEDLLKTPEDERFFEYYATSQLLLVKLAGPVRTLPVKGILDEVSGSPDGRYAFVSERHRPFSYAFPLEAFPVTYSVIDLKTGGATKIAEEPLADSVPIAADAVVTGPRDLHWRADAPATLVWAEAADGGDPRAKLDVHDRLFALSAPFNAKPELLLELPMRFSSVAWGTDHIALVAERRRKDRTRVLLLLDPSTRTATTFYQGSTENRYADPGQPMLAPNASGKPALQFTNDHAGIYFSSLGASPDGDRPFIGVMDLAGGHKEQQIWRSKAPFYEQPLALLKDGSILIQRESVDQQPNDFIVKADGSPTQVTSFPNPYGTTKLPTKQLLRYKRADGVDLTATLWLPAGYNKADGPLPTLMEAYPAEFKTRSGAGELAGSPYRFPRLGWGSAVFFAATGYAVLENASIPILGEGKQEPNDTYVEQLVSAAKAAVDAGVATGTVDRKHVAAMGHSYGAFMTANLLAHSDLFCAGIARSGAYNRTLTPFGFQNEERTYWQAPEIYYNMSPFSYADKIKAPLLMIHGMADDNQGTFPIQSERFYAALKGQGATVRLVFLPLEAHHYDAHESVYHMLWEMNHWLDTYVKTPNGSNASATK
jgi:dipeptidyl aminopeptidase/acylaminoacyl peptidase